MEISGGIDICQISFPTGTTAILLLVCILFLLSTKCPAASILRSARFSRMQTTKKPHGYHKIAVWQKDDRIRKSPLKFYVQYYCILSGDCQALILTELWLNCGVLLNLKISKRAEARSNHKFILYLLLIRVYRINAFPFVVRKYTPSSS